MSGRHVLAPAVLAIVLSAGCGSLTEPTSRDLDTPAYLETINRVPSFWTEDVDGEIVIPFYVRDDVFPPGVDPDLLREVARGAVATWLEPLEANGRRVRLPILWATKELPPPDRRVQLFFIPRGDGFLGITRYDGSLVQVEIAVHAQSTDRFQTRRELLALTTHEVGHALGISQPGHSPNPNDVMFGHNLQNTWITLSEGDRQVILSLFPG